jgi:HEAT repeat protein
VSRALDEGLASDDAELRRRAVAMLEEDGAPDREAKLVRALGDPDWRVRKEAARVASEHAEAWGLFPRLVGELCQGENVGSRNSAIEVFERVGPRAAGALLAALPSAPEAARKFIAQALGFAGSAGVEKLAEISHDPEANTAQAAIEALAHAGGRRAEEALVEHLASESPVKRLAALEGLDRLHAKIPFARLQPLLSDRLVRRIVVRALGSSDDPAAVSALFSVLSDASAATVLEAVVALGRVLERGGPAAAQAGQSARGFDESVRAALRAISVSTAERARQAAAWLLLLARDREILGLVAELAAEDRLSPLALDALRGWGSDAVPLLLDTSVALSPRARGAALEMASELAAAGGERSSELRAPLLAALRAALRADEPALAAAAASAIASWADASDAPLLVESASRFPEQVARACGRALERLAALHPGEVKIALGAVTLDGALGAALLPATVALGGADASDRLQAALSADDARARRAAVLALPRLGGVRAAELAGFALADEDIDVQTAAVLVLAQLTDAEGRPLGAPHLRLALRSDVEPVAAAAARALGAIGDHASIPALRDVVREGRAGVAVAAMESLRAQADPGLGELLVEALGQPDEELVKEALRAIAEQDDAPRKSARVALALEHPAWDVRQLAAHLLGEIGGEAAAAALSARAARESDDAVRAAIHDALAALGGGGP